MNGNKIFQGLADGVLFIHLLFVAFVIGGLIFIFWGNWRRWRWVNGFFFRVLHLAAIALVAGQSWCGARCPLTVLEMWLRERAHEPAYHNGFIEHWLQRVLYYTAPHWVFTAAYTLFGLAVAGAWIWFPPSALGAGLKAMNWRSADLRIGLRRAYRDPKRKPVRDPRSAGEDEK